MPLSRRSLVSGAVALAALAAVPCSDLLADSLTAEEHRLMALVPPYVGAEGRAFILEALRDPDPIMRRVVAKILHLSPPQRLALLRWLELTEEAWS